MTASLLATPSAACVHGFGTTDYGLRTSKDVRRVDAGAANTAGVGRVSPAAAERRLQVRVHRRAGPPVAAAQALPRPVVPAAGPAVRRPAGGGRAGHPPGHAGRLRRA